MWGLLIFHRCSCCSEQHRSSATGLGACGTQALGLTHLGSSRPQHIVYGLPFTPLAMPTAIRYPVWEDERGGNTCGRAEETMWNLMSERGQEFTGKRKTGEGVWERSRGDAAPGTWMESRWEGPEPALRSYLGTAS